MRKVFAFGGFAVPHAQDSSPAIRYTLHEEEQFQQRRLAWEAGRVQLTAETVSLRLELERLAQVEDWVQWAEMRRLMADTGPVTGRRRPRALVPMFWRWPWWRERRA